MKKIFLLVLLLAGCERTTCHTVRIDLNGGTSYYGSREVRVGDGRRAPKPADPTGPEGYEKQYCAGWFSAAEGGTQWNFDIDRVTSDLLLYAHYENYCTVRFHANGGAFADSNYGTNLWERRRLKVGEWLWEPDNVLRQGYTLVGWSRSAEGDDRWNFRMDVVQGDVDLYAVWKENAR